MENYFAGIAATIAAIVSLMNYYQSISMHKDNIRVSLWTRRFEVRPEKFLHIINRRGHKTVVVDYGFIDVDGYLHSMVVIDELDDMTGDTIVSSGSTVMEQPSDFFEAGFNGEPDYVVRGAFAVTSSREKIFIMIDSTIPLHSRIVVHLKILKNRINRFFTGAIIYR
ncbi:hypothetical protein [Halomonas sp. SCS19]|uniref:hypothetical protein n=1 Tax=Halomonas sp. SCS19 TaxID=2950870 RepID=UPI0032E03AED